MNKNVSTIELAPINEKDDLCRETNDPILSRLSSVGLAAQKLDDIVYQILYKNLSVLYFPTNWESGYVRFACPKIIRVDDKVDLPYLINRANTMVSGIKFVNMEGDVWAFCEYKEHEDVESNIMDVFENLLNGICLFQQISMGKK